MKVNASSDAIKASHPYNLAYEIPALSFAAGGTKIGKFQKQQTIDMNNEMSDGWPISRLKTRPREWLHSDFKDVAYRYTYKLFDSFVNEGSLR